MTTETVDRNARWDEIQNIARAVAMKDETPTTIESALCGAVVRAKALEDALRGLMGAEGTVNQINAARVARDVLSGSGV